MKIKIAEKKEWDEIVENSSHGTIFHRWDFLKVMEKHTKKRIIRTQLKGKFIPLIAYNGTEPVGSTKKSDAAGIDEGVQGAAFIGVSHWLGHGL